MAKYRCKTQSAIPTDEGATTATAKSAGGRLGNSATRQQNKAIGDYLQQKGWTVTGGGGQVKEEYLPPLSGKGRAGSNYIDITAISFDGTTANCRVSVSADRSTDQISAVIQLWNGSTRIARWTDSGTGYLLFSNSATVSKGKTYELTVDVKINGVSKPQVSIEGTCK